MGLRSFGATLSLVGIAGFIIAFATGPHDTPMFFAVESTVALVTGMTLLGIGAFRHGYHWVPVGAPPGDMDMSKAIDPRPPADGRP